MAKRVLSICLLVAFNMSLFGQLNWVRLGEPINGFDSGLRLGEAVALSSDGSTLVLLAPGYVESQFGFAAVYDWNEKSSSWIQRGHKFFISM